MSTSKSKPKVRKILKILKDFKKVTEYPSIPTQNISIQNIEPPSYIVQILLLNVLNLKNFGPMDKVLWHTFFEFEGQTFMIRDYKFGSWTIEGNIKKSGNKTRAKKIHKKIQDSSKHIDQVLSEMMNIQVKRGNFSINNSFNKLFKFFVFYKTEVDAAIKAYDAEQKKIENIRKTTKPKSLSVKNIQDYFTKVLFPGSPKENEITYFTYAMITIFFSLTEFLFETLYAFERPNLTIDEFKKKYWNEKFNIFFPIDSDKKITKIYWELIEIKRNYRNPLTHGLLDESGFLVPLKNIGLVPLSYGNPSKKLNYESVEINKEAAKKIISVFNKFLKYLTTNDPYRYYIHFLENGFPIPMKKSRAEVFKKQMTSMREFKKFVSMTLEYQDMVANRDI